jgi:hypothetical protein
MDARIEGQLGGVVHTVPTRGNSPSVDSRAQSPGAVKPRSNADTPDLPAEVFDANADGAIEHWSFAHGGDSYATFKPPPSGAAGSNLRRVSHAPPVAATGAAAAHTTRHANAHATTAAAFHHAREAYQRDGGATGADPFPAKAAGSAPTPTTPSRAPGPNPAPPTVTQSPPVAALPSPRS